MIAYDLAWHFDLLYYFLRFFPALFRHSRLLIFLLLRCLLLLTLLPKMHLSR